MFKKRKVSSSTVNPSQLKSVKKLPRSLNTDTPTSRKKMQRGRAKKLSPKMLQALKASKHNCMYACPICGGVVARKQRVSSIEIQENLRLTCTNCTSKVKVNTLECLRCHRNVMQCFCKVAETNTFTITPPGVSDRDISLIRPKATFFLDCPGRCGATINSPYKIERIDAQRQRFTCHTCKDQCAQAHGNENLWRHTLMEAMCIRCKECFNECQCEDEYTATELMKMTKLGATLRAEARREKRKDIDLKCSCCVQIVKAEEVSEYTLTDMKRGHTLGPRHPECAKKPMMVATEMQCAKCDTIITSANCDGQVN